jgi:predicted nucleic acid-binding protein
MIVMDTSVLIDAMTGPKRSLPQLRRLIQDGERILLTTIVLFEWRRGPRQTQEVSDQETLFPADEALPFGTAEALLAADLYRQLKRSRGREIDIAIASCALIHGATLWTLNTADFKDIPNLRLL